MAGWVWVVRCLRLLTLAAILLVPAAATQAASIVRESVYNYLIIDNSGRIVTFRRLESGATVSAIDTKDPTNQVVPYTSYLFSPVLVSPAPKSVLNLGLGAGAFNRLFNLAFPDSNLTSVEIDPMILDAAKEFTGFRTSDRNEVEIADGRRYLRLSKDKWDWIVIDVYIRNSQIPPHMTTVEFYRQVRDHLTDNGAMAVNVIASATLTDRIQNTIAAVFPSVVRFEVPMRANVVVLGSMKPGAMDALRQFAPPPQEAILEKNSVALPEFRHSANAVPKAEGAKLLTDDFAPTEFLDLR